jgi:hypothetical protein
MGRLRSGSELGDATRTARSSRHNSPERRACGAGLNNESLKKNPKERRFSSTPQTKIEANGLIQ